MKEQTYPWLEIIHLEETDSTSNQIKHLPITRELTVVTTDYQTAGRGQKGNSWEAERGANLLFSILLSPRGVTASQQFILSQAISLAIAETLLEYYPDFQIKWPNDIYWQEKKMGGILIENELRGKNIERCVVGIGLNINQQTFHSDAPNPISLAMITGTPQDRDAILMRILEIFHTKLQAIACGETHAIVESYHDMLFRKDGFHPYRDENGIFWAAIDHVEPLGPICLRDKEGNLRTYAFKEIKVILKDVELPN